MDYLARFTLSYDLPVLYQQVSNQGWEIKKVKFDKTKNGFVASAQNPHGEEIESVGPSEKQAVFLLLHQVMGKNSIRSSKLSKWQTTFTDQLVPIAEAYSKAPAYEPKAAVAFMELARDAERRAKTLAEHLEITLTHNPEPYKNAEKMCEDVRKRRKLEVSRAGTEHPLWSPEQVVAFRIAFDVLGFCASDGDWGWEGTNQAFSHYAPLVGLEAQKALFAEVIGQTAYSTYYRAYGPTKIALFPTFMDPAQKEHNPHDGYRGVHPDKTVPPIEEPRAKRLARRPYVGNPDGSLATDINAGWQSPNADKPLFNYDLEHDRSTLGLDELSNLTSDYGGDPNSSGLATGWANPLRGTGQDVIQQWRTIKQEQPEVADRVYKAVSNAIRAACLSPRTMLHHNAQQYQDLQNVNYRASDPNQYWDALENARQEWNVSRFGEDARHEHRPWFSKMNDSQPEIRTDAKGKKKKVGKVSPYERLTQLLLQRNPTEGHEMAQREAQRMINEVKTNFQAKLEDQNEDRNSNTPDDQAQWLVDNESNKMVLRWIDTVTKPSTKHDVYSPSVHEDVGNEWVQTQNPWGDDPEDEEMTHEARQRKVIRQHHDYGDEYEGYDNHKIFNLQRYGAFMGTQMQAIAKMTQHIDDLVEAALWDVENEGGRGHHFRQTVLSLNIPGIGAKQISFMWLLLQPLTTQLATIDVHMSRMLGHTEDDINDRDYFRMERELMARRDAMGLQRIPLGQFQWACWDLQRSGQRATPQAVEQVLEEGQLFHQPQYQSEISTHQDHSALRVLDPRPAWQTPWLPPPPKKRPYQFDFMQATDPAAKQVAEDWNANEAKNFKKDETPVQLDVPAGTFAKVAMSTATPWFVHPETGQQIHGQPGMTLMQHLRNQGFDLNTIWNQFDGEQVGKLL